MDSLFTTEFLKFALPAAGAVVAWLVNQRQQRASQEYVRKEKLYRGLLDALQGFYDPPSNLPAPFSTNQLERSDPRHDKRQEFLDQIRLAWLYSPDDVISKAYTFLNTIHAQRQDYPTDREKEIALGDVVAAVRKDLLPPRLGVWPRTRLAGKDYRHLRPS